MNTPAKSDTDVVTMVATIVVAGGAPFTADVSGPTVHDCLQALERQHGRHMARVQPGSPVTPNVRVRGGRDPQ